jgi:FAD:protein FMN transferase
MRLVHLNREDFTVRFEHAGVMLDLGAIGKGYAIEKAAELLREAGVTSALLHGGTSTVCAIGNPPDAEFWKVAIEDPEKKQLVAVVRLKNEALSISAVWGKSFEADGKTFGHVIDPRTGQPVSECLLSAVILPSAMETDALSTALLTLGASGHEKIHSLRSEMRSLLIVPDASMGWRVESRGIETGISASVSSIRKNPVESSS